MLEYLMVMVVIVVMVFLAFKNRGDSIMSQTRNKTSEYFDTGAAAIMGGQYQFDPATNSSIFIRREPQPVDGGWCEATSCVGGFSAKECACPRPAFGGDPCPGTAVTACGSSCSGCKDPTTIQCGGALGYDGNCSACPGHGTACAAGECSSVNGAWVCS
jgi:hypothetical protein